jgi:starch-binding outer membrane protein, SusD/RagB family
MSYVKNGSELTGYTYPTKFITDTRTSIKKYVVGSPAGNKNKGGFMRTYINTNMMRFAEVYLIAAEAIMGNAKNTSNQKAIDYFNMVRKRAGLSERSSSITDDDILKERRIEMVFEGDYWYDLCRIDRGKATDIISKQERGTNGSGSTIYSLKVTPKDEDFLFKIPAAEIITNPKLAEAPVKYY